MAACMWNRVVGSGLAVLQPSFWISNQALKRSQGAVEQVRSYYVDWRMLRDVKRRQMAFEYADERLRINALRKNNILPKQLQEVADKEIAALPRDSCPVRIRNSPPRILARAVHPPPRANTLRPAIVPSPPRRNSPYLSLQGHPLRYSASSCRHSLSPFGADSQLPPPNGAPGQSQSQAGADRF